MDKKKNILKILIVIICLCGVSVFALFESGVSIPLINTYKNNFKKNLSGISDLAGIQLPIEVQLYLDDMSTPAPKPTMMPAEEQEELLKALGYPKTEPAPEAKEGTTALTTKKPIEVSGKAMSIAFDSAENTRFVFSKYGILCANETQYVALSQTGKIIWEQNIQMQNPVICVNGNYVLINETGSKKISLYKGKKLLFSTETSGNIISCDLSSKGDVIAVTEKEYYKGQIVVFNNKGKIIYAWDSGSYSILDADISDSRRICVALLNTDEGADSFIEGYDVNGKKYFSTDNFKDTLIFDVDYCDDRIMALSDTTYMGISQKGKISWEYPFEGRILGMYSTAENGNKMLLFETQSAAEMVVVTPRGKAYAPVGTESMPDTINIKSSSLAYNSGRDVIITDYKGKKLIDASCDSDIKQVHIIDSNHVLCVYSSSIQIQKLTKRSESKTAEVIDAPAPTEVPQQ